MGRTRGSTDAVGLKDTSSSWMAVAACKDAGPDVFFAPDSEAYAIAFCSRCKVRAECLSYAVTNRIPDGIYGGLTGPQRAKGLQNVYPIVPAAGAPALRNQVLELHRQGLTWRQINLATGMPYRQVARFLSTYPRVAR